MSPSTPEVDTPSGMRLAPNEAGLTITRNLPSVDHHGEIVEEVGPDSVRVRLPFRPEYMGRDTWQDAGGRVYSGPMVMGFADTAMYVCVMAALGWGAIPVMTNLNITFLRPARAADLIARARIVRRGARLFYLECWLSSDGDEQPCAHITSTYRVARNGGGEGEKLPRGETAMTNENAGLGWSDLLKMGAEVRADDGPGSKDWHAAGSETQRVNALYMQALRANQGKVPGELSVVPSLIITTVGARSGEKRSVPLACQVIDGRLVIVASMGGSVRNPPWFHNLVKNPRVVVEKDGETFEATAVVTEGEDRRYLYDKVAEALPAFKEYQERTARVIPVIELKRSA